MLVKYPQGRLKVIQTTPSCLEWIYTWPKSENQSKEDARLILNLAIVWQYIDSVDDDLPLWSIEGVDAVMPCWMDIDTNFTLNESVLKYTRIMFKSLLEHLWRTNLQMKTIRNYEMMLNKAAIDIESSKVAGYLKIAAITTTIRPELLSFNGFTRKVPASHFACSVMIIIRSKATSNDVTNYYTMKSHLENKVRLYL